ncbi:MAG: alpha-L-fucosidase [Candidatus Marinimicrobia bacterium]|nr:alpha-L-fucosidase [Candidatus Neomarinimicrobiota bacterium]
MKKLLLILLITVWCFGEALDRYFPPEDKLVRQKLETWQDVKFGLMMHWAPYSQWGVMASWTLCCDEWAHRTRGRYQDYHSYVKDYFALAESFNPVKFDPERWAEAANQAGMKYLVFTTKHHDGFCMFDTKTTDYKITNPEYPFAKYENANIVREVFSAFREKDFWIGAYFSKPDWHCEYYWWPYFETGDRNVNYSIRQHPERWEQFKKYTYDQIQELMTYYGNIDVLWLDGAQVQPKYYEQDIDMPKIADMARKMQPGLLIVDRLVEGPYQNYLTPENQIPSKRIDVPWESCITMADDGWSYRFNVHYKSTNELIHTLVEIIAKGGNLLLNIGPDGQGDWDTAAYRRLEEIGKWMAVNSEAVYGTRSPEIYEEENIFFVKKGADIYAFYLLDEEQKEIPLKIVIESYQPKTGSSIKLLGYDKQLSWQKNGEGMVIFLNDEMISHPPCQHTLTFKLEI